MRILCATPVDDIHGLIQRMKKLGDVVYVPHASREAVRASLNDVEVIFVNPNRQRYRIDEDLLSDPGRLKWIVTASTGTDHIDIHACVKHGIEIVALTTEMNVIRRIPSTAEHAFCLTLSAARRIVAATALVGKGEWDYEHVIGMQLAGASVAVIGYGRLGQMYAKYCEAFGMNDIYIVDPKRPRLTHPFMLTNIETAIENANVISVHVHLNDVTRHMIDETLLSKAKKQPILINTSRGGVVDESAVLTALDRGWLSTYATDVLEDELDGVNDKHPLILRAHERKDVIVTPHVGGMTHKAREIAYHGVLDVFEKKLNEQHVVFDGIKF